MVGEKLRVIADATLFHFGVLTSAMHMSWMRLVTGRLKSDYQYSAKLVYNNYPWPQSPTEKQRVDVETAAQAVLDARLLYPNSTLADLYDPLSMPAELTKAHNKLELSKNATAPSHSHRIGVEWSICSNSTNNLRSH